MEERRRWNIVDSTLKVPKDPPDHTQVRLTGIMHVETYLLDNIRDVGPGKAVLSRAYIW
jgi:hypothetical protein